MARPRKDADAPDARTRIIEAFWELIENNSIFELSVGEVTRAAQCNRGTFYYYFHDFDELVAIAIAQLRLLRSAFVLDLGASTVFFI